MSAVSAACCCALSLRVSPCLQQALAIRQDGRLIVYGDCPRAEGALKACKQKCRSCHVDCKRSLLLCAELWRLALPAAMIGCQ